MKYLYLFFLILIFSCKQDSPEPIEAKTLTTKTPAAAITIYNVSSSYPKYATVRFVLKDTNQTQTIIDIDTTITYNTPSDSLVVLLECPNAPTSGKFYHSFEVSTCSCNLDPVQPFGNAYVDPSLLNPFYSEYIENHDIISFVDVYINN